MREVTIYRQLRVTSRGSVLSVIAGGPEMAAPVLAIDPPLASDNQELATHFLPGIMATVIEVGTREDVRPP